MAKKQTTTSPKSTPAVSKADAIRAYYKEHPELGPKDIAEALTKQGVEVTAGRVSGVLRSGTSNKVDVDTIKRAAEFVGQEKVSGPVFAFSSKRVLTPFPDTFS